MQIQINEQVLRTAVGNRLRGKVAKWFRGWASAIECEANRYSGDVLRSDERPDGMRGIEAVILGRICAAIVAGDTKPGLPDLHPAFQREFEAAGLFLRQKVEQVTAGLIDELISEVYENPSFGRAADPSGPGQKTELEGQPSEGNDGPSVKFREFF